MSIATESNPFSIIVNIFRRLEDKSICDIHRVLATGHVMVWSAQI